MAGPLQDAADRLGLPLDPTQVRRLLAYLRLLHRWNATFNLTAVRDPAQMLTLHVVDCLAAVAPLQRETSNRPVQVLDVGSGAGLPGAVIAILDAATTVTCVDAVSKKAAFVQQVAGELGLPNLTARHARVEGLTRERFDVVTARAFSSLLELVALTNPLLADGGIWMAMKGKRPDAEIAALPETVSMFHVEPLTVPGLDAERCLVWMRPTTRFTG
jgi:16S rRNA (guanine527-N7)-methyltransferase